MSLTKKAAKLMITGAVAVAISGASPANAMGDMEGKEKCYGVVKAGKNMCGRKDGKHSCMHQATTDGDAQEWLLLPKGICENLVNGSLVSGDSEGDSENDEHGHEH